MDSNNKIKDNSNNIKNGIKNKWNVHFNLK